MVKTKSQIGKASKRKGPEEKGVEYREFSDINEIYLKRFFDKVNIPEEVEACWLWTAGKRVGYGIFWFVGKHIDAHRFSYLYFNGEVPRELDHLCRTPACINPFHLEGVTHQENCLRGRAGWQQKAKTHCPQGHEYTDYRERHSRVCKECVKVYNDFYRKNKLTKEKKREYDKEYRRKKKAREAKQN